MSLWWKKEIQGTTYEVLRVPHQPQGIGDNPGQSDWYCMPCSVKMLLDFMVDVYQDETIQQQNRAWKVSEVADELPFDPYGGCKVRDNMFESLNEQLRYFKLEPRELDSLEDVKEELEQHDRPVILFYSPRTLNHGEMGGPAHAVVAIGLTEGSVIVNDPWEPSPVRHNRERFEQAWTLGGYNTARVRPKTEQTHLPSSKETTKPLESFEPDEDASDDPEQGEDDA